MPLRAPGASGGTPVVSRDGTVSWVRLEGAATPIIDFVKQNLPGYLKGRYLRDASQLPVGIGNLSLLPSGGGVLKLPSEGAAPLTIAGPALSGPVIVQDKSQDQGVVQKNMTLRDFLGTGLLSNEQWNRAISGDPGSPAEIRALQRAQASVPKLVPEPDRTVAANPILQDPTSAPIAGPVKQSSKGGSMDLGDIVKTLGTTYIQTKYAPSQQTLQQPVYSLPQMGSDIIDFFTDDQTGSIVPVMKKKPCRRRRRRRLATKSDLGDLAALKAILGNGEAFKAWIATHSR